jgi:Diiron non-heme beta-hydroxylase N-terminal domain
MTAASSAVRARSDWISRCRSWCRWAIRVACHVQSTADRAQRRAPIRYAPPAAMTGERTMVQQGDVYLRSDLNFEPLVNGFYAWLHSVAPAPAALNLAKNLVPILRSYIAAPQVHQTAARNPATKGGPFADIRSVPIEEVCLLLERIVAENEQTLAFAAAIDTLDVRLVEGATGFALRDFYDTLPAELAGLVELAYDTHHRATITFNEPLLYRTMFDPSRHAVAVSVATTDDRPFVLSSPRLASEDTAIIATPLGGGFFTDVHRAQFQPATMDSHCERLGFDADAALTRTFFTDEPPRRGGTWALGDDVGVRYFGHASVMFAVGDKVIAVDPLVTST